MKKFLTTAIASALGLAAGTASAGQFADVATVLSTTPVYERIATPRRECRTEQVAAYEERRVARPVQEETYRDPNPGIGAGTVLGAIVGGVIGHQFGGSSAGRDHGAGVGAVLGGLVGHDMESNNAAGNQTTNRDAVEVDRVPVTRDVQRCRMVSDYREEVTGYDVRYNYQGREYTTRLAYDPGQTLPVEVSVRPLPQQPAYRRY